MGPISISKAQCSSMLYTSAGSCCKVHCYILIDSKKKLETTCILSGKAIDEVDDDYGGGT